MHLKFENCNDAWPVTVDMIKRYGVIRNSRNGRVAEYPEPVTISYTKPTRRVLFCDVRNINPFLHFFEPLWILAGRRDVAFLSNIVSRFREYSDDGEVFNAAYGFRLRDGVDQIETAIERLRKNPDDRQVVLQIRKPDDILYHGKDTACNLSVALKVRDGFLDIHVFNRSNDVVWGGPAGGANYPQFTVLQEYLAGRINCEIGTYHHTTDSMHAYIDSPDWKRISQAWKLSGLYAGLYPRSEPLFKMKSENDDLSSFDKDLFRFFEYKATSGYRTSYFNDVVSPMWDAFKDYKNGKEVDVDAIGSDDWAIAVDLWLGRKNK